MRRSLIGAGVSALFLLFGAASAGAQAISVIVSPPSASLQPNGAKQFEAKAHGSTDAAVTWLVNGVRGGTPSTGVISEGGLYTAPADVAKPLAVTVEATAAAAPTATGEASVAVAAVTNRGQTYYVAAAGNDDNPGTASKPWRHIQHAVETAPSGSTILVHGGVYNELVTITRSGFGPGGFTSLEAVAGQTPVIDGAGLGIPNAQNGLITIDNASYIRIVGFEIRNYVSHDAAVPIGVYVEGAGSYIELLSNHIHNIATTLGASAADALGVAIYGTKATPISQLIIDGNELDDLTLGYSESLSLSGNVTEWQVTNNLIHDNNNIGINIEGFFGTAPVAYDFARNGLVAGNTVYNITSQHNPAYGDSRGADGIYVDGGAYVTVQRNVVHNADYGLELASEVHGRATTQALAHDNVIYHSYVAGITIGGASSSNGGTSDCVIANNTLFDNDTTQSGSGEFQIQLYASDNVFDNNILFANAQGLLVNDPAKASAAPAGLDHNLYDSSAGASGSQWIWRGKTYNSFAAYRAGAGLDAHSKFANPQFVDFGERKLQTRRDVARHRPRREPRVGGRRSHRRRRRSAHPRRDHRRGRLRALKAAAHEELGLRPGSDQRNRSPQLLRQASQPLAARVPILSLRRRARRGGPANCGGPSGSSLRLAPVAAVTVPLIAPCAGAVTAVWLGKEQRDATRPHRHRTGHRRGRPRLALAEQARPRPPAWRHLCSGRAWLVLFSARDLRPAERRAVARPLADQPLTAEARRRRGSPRRPTRFPLASARFLGIVRRLCRSRSVTLSPPANFRPARRRAVFWSSAWRSARRAAGVAVRSSRRRTPSAVAPTPKPADDPAGGRVHHKPPPITPPKTPFALDPLL